MNASSGNTGYQLDSGMQAERAVMADLLETLQQEQNSLIAADVEQLLQLTEQKNQLVQRASALSQQRLNALAAAGFAQEEANMAAWLTRLGRSELQQSWHSLLDLTRQAKEINRLNGMLINRQLANTQNALQALQPPSAATPAQHLYGPSGHSTLSQGSRRLVIG
ncbi:flagellar protein FlgN [Massilia sp. W12]|uniref:flagella synthesis protein FlgN n=1 Tax=Massilia sp. W12 TaxID=3126507 RepID=UPI0030CBB228